mmetsp:Transcript_7088/g.8161  ORF Transcript_7088/g.8161 Transcript_7088/m.8161 type:complete len:268 (+) Transcript_7088:63-866(+)
MLRCIFASMVFLPVACSANFAFVSISTSPKTSKNTLVDQTVNVLRLNTYQGEHLIFGARSCSALQMAKANKKRRRRKMPDEISPTSSSSEISSTSPSKVIISYDDLPDFDFDEDVPESSSATDPGTKAAMMGSSPVGLTSPTDLLRSRDRSVEEKFEFDEVEDPLPKPGFAFSQPSVEVGKKQAKSDARRAAALEKEESLRQEEPRINQIIKTLPFDLGRDGDGKVTATKILEVGAWLGIALLVLLEFFINSPLFDRSGTMIPAVFE